MLQGNLYSAHIAMQFLGDSPETKECGRAERSTGECVFSTKTANPQDQTFLDLFRFFDLDSSYLLDIMKNWFPESSVRNGMVHLCGGQNIEYRVFNRILPEC